MGKLRTLSLAVLIIVTLVNLLDQKRLTGPLYKQTADDLAVYDLRLQELRAFLPREGVIGYLSDTTPAGMEAGQDVLQKFYRAQYALAPLIINPEAHTDLVIANYSDPSLARMRTKGFVVIKDFGGGLALLQKKTS